MSLDVTAFTAALKQHYTNDQVENLVYKDNPFLALVTKMEDFGGLNLPIPLISGNPQNRSVTFTTAQGGTTTSSIKAFTLTRVKDYSFAFIDNEVMEASKGNGNAFLEAATTEIDGAMNSLTRSLATSMYRSGYGDIGVIATGGISSATITLATASDSVNFEVNQVLQLSATQSGALRSGTVTVQSVDRNLGTVTCTGNVTSGIAAAAAGDSIFINGDHTSGSITKVSGLEAWCPSTAPTSAAFFGVDRSVDPTRLGGQRFSGVGKPLEENLIDGAVKVAREGGKLSHYFMSYETYGSLEKSLGAKVQYVDVKMNPEIAFRGMLINGPRGPIKVIPDQNCPTSRVFGVTLDSWKLYSLGKAVKILNSDGNEMLRQGTADGVEVRVGFYGNLATRSPGWNVNIQI